MSSVVLGTIALSALFTYFLRLGGLLLADRLPKTGHVKKFLEALPGSILVSFVTPALIYEGYVGWIAGIVIALCTYKTRNVLLSMIIGVGIVLIGRNMT